MSDDNNILQNLNENNNLIVLNTIKGIKKLSSNIIKVFCRDPKKDKLKLLEYLAFYHWAKNTLLIDKCDEMSRQLKERNEVIVGLRQAYLRDIIR